MRILLLGGTRFIGPHVVRALIGRGHEVTIFHRGQTETDFPTTVRHVHGDFAGFAEHVEPLRALAPEVVVDMVPFREEDAQRLRSFKGVAQSVVAISSGDVYRAFGRIWRTEPGPPDPVPLTEDSPLREQLSNAGLDYNKPAVERSLLADDEVPVTIIRAPATYGPGDAQHRLFQYIKRMDDGRPAIVLEESFAAWRWARSYVEDVAHAIVLAVTNKLAAGRIYNVAYPTAFSEAEWVREISNVLGWRGDVISVPMDELPMNLRHEFDLRQQYSVDSTRIRRELGYTEQIPFVEGLRRTIDWERDHPPTDLAHQIDYVAEDAMLGRLKKTMVP